MDKAHAAPEKPSYPLIGQPPMTAEERAAFLQQARQVENAYRMEVDAVRQGEISPIRRKAVFVGESSLELSSKPKSPDVLVKDIQANMLALEENTKLLNKLTAQADLVTEADKIQAAADRSWLLSKLEQSRENIKTSLRRLEDVQVAQMTVSDKQTADLLQKIIADARIHLQSFESDALSKGMKVDVDPGQKVNVSTNDAAWHKKWVDPSQPLHLTEGFNRFSATGRNAESVKPQAEFKPNIAPDNSRALFTHSGETGHKIAWHQDPKNFSYDQPVSGEALKRTSKLTLVAMGLLAASEAANATPGSLADQLSAAGHVLKDVAIDAVPGVTYMEKMQAGRYEEAALDAASYLPFGDITAMANSPEVQAVIDKLPKDQSALKSMMTNQAEPPVNRHLAEYQLLVTQAKQAGDVMKYLAFSSDLNNLAEKKLKLQETWAQNAEIFGAALQDTSTNWRQLANQHPDLAPHIAIHLASVRSGHPAAFVSQMDAQLTDSLAKGVVPILHSIAAEASQNKTDVELSLTGS